MEAELPEDVKVLIVCKVGVVAILVSKACRDMYMLGFREVEIPHRPSKEKIAQINHSFSTFSNVHHVRISGGMVFDFAALRSCSPALQRIDVIGDLNLSGDTFLLPHLRILNIKCRTISTSCLENLVRSCPLLEQLKLLCHGSRPIDAERCQLPRSFHLRCPKMTDLSLTYEAGAWEEGWGPVDVHLEACELLNSLELKGFRHFYSQHSRLSGLRCLKLDKIVSESEIADFLSNCPLLRVLDIAVSSSVSIKSSTVVCLDVFMKMPKEQKANVLLRIANMGRLQHVNADVAQETSEEDDQDDTSGDEGAEENGQRGIDNESNDDLDARTASASASASPSYSDSDNESNDQSMKDVDVDSDSDGALNGSEDEEGSDHDVNVSDESENDEGASDSDRNSDSDSALDCGDDHMEEGSDHDVRVSRKSENDKGESDSDADDDANEDDEPVGFGNLARRAVGLTPETIVIDVENLTELRVGKHVERSSVSDNVVVRGMGVLASLTVDGNFSFEFRQEDCLQNLVELHFLNPTKLESIQPILESAKHIRELSLWGGTSQFVRWLSSSSLTFDALERLNLQFRRQFGSSKYPPLRIECSMLKELYIENYSGSLKITGERLTELFVSGKGRFELHAQELTSLEIAGEFSVKAALPMDKLRKLRCEFEGIKSLWDGVSNVRELACHVKGGVGKMPMLLSKFQALECLKVDGFSPPFSVVSSQLTKLDIVTQCDSVEKIVIRGEKLNKVSLQQFGNGRIKLETTGESVTRLKLRGNLCCEDFQEMSKVVKVDVWYMSLQDVEAMLKVTTRIQSLNLMFVKGTCEQECLKKIMDAFPRSLEALIIGHEEEMIEKIDDLQHPRYYMVDRGISYSGDGLILFRSK